MFSRDQAYLVAKVATVIAVFAAWLLFMSAAFCSGLGCNMTRYSIGIVVVVGALFVSWASTLVGESDVAVAAAAVVPLATLAVVVLPS